MLGTIIVADLFLSFIGHFIDKEVKKEIKKDAKKAASTVKKASKDVKKATKEYLLLKEYGKVVSPLDIPQHMIKLLNLCFACINCKPFNI